MSDYRIVEDTQIQVTNTYKRNKTKRAKLKRNFNFVLQGMMLSSVMLSSTLGVNGGKAFAIDLDTTSDGGTKTPEPDSNIQDVTYGIHDEQAKIFNLKNANRVLEAAIKTGQLDKWVYERVMTALIDLDVHLDATQTINNSSAIIDVLMKTEELLSPEYTKKLEADEQTENIRYNAELSLLSVKETLKELTGNQDVTFDLDTGKPVSKPIAVTASTTSVPLQGYSQNDKGDWNPNVDSTSSTVTLSSQGPTKVEQAPTIDMSAQGPVMKVSIYDDFNPNEYWADNMLWMINQGYITGYIKQKHPTTGKYGTWLNPYGNLTESQMLSVLLRYKLGLQGYDALMANTSAPANFWSFPLYQKAQQLGIVTKGSTSNKNYQSTQVTRGQLAQALVSMHYGKSVTLEEAVQFMFDNNITTGTNPAKGATMENFAPNTKLARAHIASFLKRYDDVVKQGNIKDLPRFKNGNNTNSGGTPTSPNPNETQYETHPNTIGKDPNIYTLKIKKGNSPDVVGSKIKTKFGERAYGARTQEEYDKTMEIVEKEFKDGKYDFEGLRKFKPAEYEAAENYFFKGKTAIKNKLDPEYRSLENQLLLGAEIGYGVFKDKFKSMEDFETMASLTALFGRYKLYINHDAYQNANYGYDPVSAYDLLVKGLWDCTSSAYYITAMLDQMGIDSFVLHSPGRVHDYIVINVYGDWYVIDDGPGGTGGYVKMSSEFLRPYDAILEAPNAGIDALPKFLQDIYRPSN